MIGRLFIGTLMASLSFGLMASTSQVIYGLDDRQEVYEAPLRAQLWARSVATMIPKSRLHWNEGAWRADQTSFAEWLTTQLSDSALEAAANSSDVVFCPEERFTKQPNPGQCSGFLIAPDLLVTAGHCALAQDFCEGNSWVFDFKLSEKTKTAGLAISPTDVYHCQRVIRSELRLEEGEDYALVKLDRRVRGRTPLKVRAAGKVPDQASVLVIGSPSGLPLKVAAGARVRSNQSQYYFSANLDTYQGNSGSPVLNAKSGVVEGLIVRGEEDFRFNHERSCVESNICGDGDCMGEEVSRMTSIPEIRAVELIQQAIVSNDHDELGEILGQGIWADINIDDGVTPFLRAIHAGDLRAIQLLISFGADPEHQDSMDRGALHYWTKSRSDRERVLGYLLSLGLELGALIFDLIDLGDEEGLRIILRAGASLEIRNAEGLTPLEHARVKKFEAGERVIRLHRMSRKLSWT